MRIRSNYVAAIFYMKISAYRGQHHGAHLVKLTLAKETYRCDYLSEPSAMPI